MSEASLRNNNSSLQMAARPSRQPPMTHVIGPFDSYLRALLVPAVRHHVPQEAAFGQAFRSNDDQIKKVRVFASRVRYF
jgi:hypothetical protein